MKISAVTMFWLSPLSGMMRKQMAGMIMEKNWKVLRRFVRLIRFFFWR